MTTFKMRFTYTKRVAWIEFIRRTSGYHPPNWIERRQLRVEVEEVSGEEQRVVELNVSPADLQDLIDWTQDSMEPVWGDEPDD